MLHSQAEDETQKYSPTMDGSSHLSSRHIKPAYLPYVIFELCFCIWMDKSRVKDKILTKTSFPF